MHRARNYVRSEIQGASPTIAEHKKDPTGSQIRLSPIYKWIYETAAQDSFVSTERIEGTLGFVPRYSNQDALVRNYDWYAAHRNECKGNTGISHRVAWKKGLLQFAKWFF